MQTEYNYTNTNTNTNTLSVALNYIYTNIYNTFSL